MTLSAYRVHVVDRMIKQYGVVTLFATNPTYSNLGSNQGLRGGNAATNGLSYGTAQANVKGNKRIRS
jgi:hypothetical protein